jgi:hypothetical protein
MPYDRLEMKTQVLGSLVSILALSCGLEETELCYMLLLVTFRWFVYRSLAILQPLSSQTLSQNRRMVKLRVVLCQFRTNGSPIGQSTDSFVPLNPPLYLFIGTLSSYFPTLAIPDQGNQRVPRSVIHA